MKGNIDNIVPYAPIYHPNESEFRSFKEYVYKISRVEEIRKAGCVKVGLKDCSAKILQLQHS